MSRLIEGMQEMRRVVGPAGTLMLLSVLVAGLSSLARANLEPGAPALVRSELPERVEPGARFSFSVWVEHAGPVEAYLPGLDLERVPLRPTPGGARYQGALALPRSAPERGRATLRIIAGGRTWDLPITLGPVSSS